MQFTKEGTSARWCECGIGVHRFHLDLVVDEGDEEAQEVGEIGQDVGQTIELIGQEEIGEFDLSQRCPEGSELKKWEDENKF